jgi:hypothetical protein
VPPERFVALEHRLAPTPPFGRLRVIDEASLRCAYPDGTEPYVLHNFYRKPWLVRMRSSAYSRLLTRCLLGPGLTVPIDPRSLPLRLRGGAPARVARLWVDVAIGGPSYLHRRLRPGPRGAKGWADARWRDARSGARER